MESLVVYWGNTEMSFKSKVGSMAGLAVVGILIFQGRSLNGVSRQELLVISHLVCGWRILISSYPFLTQVAGSHLLLAVRFGCFSLN